MPDAELIGRLGVWEGYKVADVQRYEAGKKDRRPQVWVTLAAYTGRSMICDGCGGSTTAAHDVAERWVRDLPVFDAETFIKLPRRRVLCPRCGPRLERLPRLHRYARVTSRFEVLAMDEFAIQKGHRYATVVIDPRRKRVLWVGRGRDRDGVRPFFDLLGPERCGRIKAVAMDMHTAFINEVKAPTLLHGRTNSGLIQVSSQPRVRICYASNERR